MKLNTSSSKHILHSFFITADFKSNEITLQNPNCCIVTRWLDLRTFMLPKLYMKMLYCALFLVLQRGVISRTGQETRCKYVQICVLLDVLSTLSLQTWCPTLVIHQWYTMKHQYIFPEVAYIHAFKSTGYSYVFVRMDTNGTWIVLIIFTWNRFVCLFHVVPRLSRRVLRHPRTCRTCAQQGVASKPRRRKGFPVSNGVQSWPRTKWQREGLGPRS